MFAGYPVSVSGMITLPVNSSMYQTMVANIQQLQSNQDGTLCITPMQVHKSACSSHHHHNHPNSNKTPAHQQHINSTGPPPGSCTTSHCGIGYSSSAVSMATTATTTTTNTTCTPAHSNPSFPLYNPYVAHQHHHAHLFGQTSAVAAAAQLRSAAAMGLAAAAAATGSSVAANAAAAAAAQHLKLNRALLRNLSPTGVGPMVAAAGDGGEALLRTLEKHLSGHGSAGGGGHKAHSANSNAHTAQANNLNNNCEHMPNAMLPKMELADDGQAVIDSDGNIIIRFGNSAPIKIECDSTDFKV